MATEFALFTSDKCIARGFPTEADALARLAEMEAAGEVTQSDEDPTTAEAMCPDHDGQPADACTHCNAEEAP